jgi:aryl-alcohol dehydrogenase (NADP+)
MKKVRLGASALEVTDLCLGTMTFGEQNSEAEGHAQLDWALAQGINFIDTAEMYPIPPRKETQGRTETIVGSWIAKNKARRKDFVLASKIAGPGRRDWIRNGDTHISAKTIPWAIDDSLKRLQTDRIDLYQIHWPERYVPAFGAWQFDPAQDREAVSIAEQVEALAKAIQAGKIRAYGLSNETAFGLCEFARVAKALGAPPPATVQNGYSVVNRLFDGDLAEASHRLAIPLLAYSPLAMGLHTDKARGGTFPKEARLGRFADFGLRYKKPRVVEAMKRYAAVADKHGLPLGALALAFVRSRFFVASTIVGATSVAQLEEQMKWAQVTLSKDALADIEAVNQAFPSPSAQ